jgi:hypothetical protein
MLDNKPPQPSCAKYSFIFIVLLLKFFHSTPIRDGRFMFSLLESELNLVTGL